MGRYSLIARRVISGRSKKRASLETAREALSNRNCFDLLAELLPPRHNQAQEAGTQKNRRFKVIYCISWILFSHPYPTDDGVIHRDVKDSDTSIPANKQREKKGKRLIEIKRLPPRHRGKPFPLKFILTCWLLAELLPAARNRKAQEAGAQKDQRSRLGDR
jgi:hypothetical protein